MTAPADRSQGLGPLRGRRIAVTRRPEQAASLVEALRGLGAEVVAVPLIEVSPPEDPRPCHAALEALAGYDWIVFTSANAVEAVADRLEAVQGRAALPERLRVATVGPATTRVVEGRFIGAPAPLEPSSEYRAEGLLAALDQLPKADVVDRRFLLPVSDRARDTLARGLRERGARVEVVVAYRTVSSALTGERVEAALLAEPDVWTFASPSAVSALVEALGERARGLSAAVIGPVTESAARAAGLRVRAVASPSTTEGLVSALVDCLR